MTEDGLQVGKLYQIRPLSRTETFKYVPGGLMVYRNAQRRADDVGERLEWIHIKPGNLVMWLGSDGCPSGWARVLCKESVWYITLGHQRNLKKLQRVL